MIITIGKITRPPFWSVQIPKNNLESEPVKIGVAIKIPNWVSVNPNSLFIFIPRIEKIVQLAKQMMKAMVLRMRALVDLAEEIFAVIES